MSMPDKAMDSQNNNIYFETGILLSSKPPKPPRSKKRKNIEEMLKSDLLVSLAGKKLTKISRKDIEKHKKAQGFDLSHNTITFTNQLCLEFRLVRYLNLSHNGLAMLPQDIYLMENLFTFDVSENKIERLPLNIYRMNRLKHFDVRGNPFLLSWNTRKGTTAGTSFDPESFTVEIKAFMMAVKEWRDFNVRLQAEEYLEYLLICPSIPPALDDVEFDMETVDYKHCPFYNLMQTQPDKVKQLTRLLDATQLPSYYYFEDFLYNTVRHHVSDIPFWILRYGIWPLIVVFLLAVAFFGPTDFAHAMTWLPNTVGTTLNPVHSKLQSYCSLFPIPPPIVTQNT